MGLYKVQGALIVYFQYSQPMIEDKDDNIINDDEDESKHWYPGVFYFNPKDKRIFPPKRWGMGWTINFGNPLSVLVLAAIITGTLLLLPLLLRK